MPGLLETDTITAQNITSSLLVGSYTATAAGFVTPQVRLSSLNGAAAVITLRLVLNDGTNDHPHARGSDLKDANADTRFARDLQAVWLTSGDVLKVYAESSNSSDTSVAGSVRFIDSGNSVDIADDLGVASSVDDATVTPTTTVFAGQSADMSSVDDLYSSGGGMLVVFTSGDMRGVPRPVVDYAGTTRAITVSPAFPAAPSDGDTFLLIGRP